MARHLRHHHSFEDLTASNTTPQWEDAGDFPCSAVFRSFFSPDGEPCRSLGLYPDEEARAREDLWQRVRRRFCRMYDSSMWRPPARLPRPKLTARGTEL